MPFNYGFSSSFYDIEVLKYAQQVPVTHHIVIDATAITLNTDPTQRTVIPAGTIMGKKGDKHIPYGISNLSTIDGILVRSVDILSNTTNNNTPAAIYRFGVIFATTAIVGYTVHAAALATALPTCRFE